MAGHPEPDPIPQDPNEDFLKMQPKDYIRNRLIPHQRWYNSRYIRMKIWHYTLQAVTIVGGLLVAWLGVATLPGQRQGHQYPGLAGLDFCCNGQYAQIPGKLESVQQYCPEPGS